MQIGTLCLRSLATRPLRSRSRCNVPGRSKDDQGGDLLFRSASPARKEPTGGHTVALQTEKTPPHTHKLAWFAPKRDRRCRHACVQGPWLGSGRYQGVPQGHRPDPLPPWRLPVHQIRFHSAPVRPNFKLAAPCQRAARGCVALSPGREPGSPSRKAARPRVGGVGEPSCIVRWRGRTARSRLLCTLQN